MVRADAGQHCTDGVSLLQQMTQQFFSLYCVFSVKDDKGSSGICLKLLEPAITFIFLFLCPSKVQSERLFSEHYCSKL